MFIVFFTVFSFPCFLHFDRKICIFLAITFILILLYSLHSLPSYISLSYAVSQSEIVILNPKMKIT